MHFEPRDAARHRRRVAAVQNENLAGGDGCAGDGPATFCLRRAEKAIVAVVGGIVLVVLSFVKGLLSLVLAVGTIGFGAYLYTNVYGDVGEKSGSTRRAESGRRRTKKKKKTEGSAARPTFSAGNVLSGLLNSTVQRKPDDGLLDVTFKKPSKPKTPKKTR